MPKPMVRWRLFVAVSLTAFVGLGCANGRVVTNPKPTGAMCAQKGERIDTAGVGFAILTPVRVGDPFGRPGTGRTTSTARGFVTVAFTLDTNGHVEPHSGVVVAYSDPRFGPKMCGALQGLRYRPYLVLGKPTRVRTRLTLGIAVGG